VPAWLFSEWVIISDRGGWSGLRPLPVGLFLLAVAYLTADDRVIAARRVTVLRWIGAIAPLPCGVFLWEAAHQPAFGTVGDAPLSPAWLALSEELWVEVTVPRRGPPRPLRLGVKKDGTLTPLDLR